MSKELPAGPATAPKKSISKPSESQKFQEVTEKFDDKKLARDVAEVSDLIAK